MTREQQIANILAAVDRGLLAPYMALDLIRQLPADS